MDINHTAQLVLSKSTDDGKTWKMHNYARTHTTEAQVVEVEPGVLMLNMRDNRGGSRAVAITKDLGKSWTEHESSRKALQEPVCMASLISVKAKDNVLNRDLLLFSNPNTTKGRHDITIKEVCDVHICEKQVVTLLERLYHLQEMGMLEGEADGKNTLRQQIWDFYY